MPLLKPLTYKQEAFAQAVAVGATQNRAYRLAYDPKKATNKTISEEGCKLAANPKIRARIEEIKEELSKQVLWTKERSVAVLSGIAVGKGELSSVKVSAVKELDLMHGFNFPKKVDVTVKGPLSIDEMTKNIEAAKDDGK